MELEVFLGQRQVGILTQAASGDFSFTYDATWVTDPQRFALSPYLPLPGEADPARLPRTSPEHSVVVRDFFQLSKQCVHFGLRHPRATIFNNDLDIRFSRLRRRSRTRIGFHDDFALLRVLDGVGDDIGHHLSDSAMVTYDSLRQTS